MSTLTRSTFSLIAIMIFTFATGCSSSSVNGPVAAATQETVPSRASASAVKLRPSPHEAKYDKGRMVDDDCIVHKTDTSVRGCVYGKPRAPVKVILVGDSHATQYGPPMIRLAHQRGWRLLALARSYCTVALVKLNPPCDRWRRKMIKRIRRAKPDLIVVASSTGSLFQVKRGKRKLNRRASERFLRTGMAKVMRRFGRFKSKRGRRTRVILLRDQALAPFRPPDCLKEKASQDDPSRCGFKAKRRPSRSFDFYGARRVPWVKIIDPLPMLCPKGWCPAVDGDMIIYRDRYHYTATWAVTMAPWLNRRIGKLP